MNERPPLETNPLTTDPQDELLPIVDENDRVIGAATRREIHARGLLHRAVHIVVLNARGDILLQRRSLTKDTYPGWWDISVGGHVDAGEENDEAVARELREEMGIVGAEAVWKTVKHPTQNTGWEFQHIYECHHDGPVTPHPHEVSDLLWMPLDAILRNEPPRPSEPGARITPSGIESITAWARATGRIA